LRQAGKVIAIAEGLHKTDSIIAALKGGYISTFITEEKTATAIAAKIGK
jgi:lsr operon transcriptional repressor